MFAADQERWSAQSSARTSPIERFIWHHQAGANDDATIGAMVSGSRQVSSTWTVDNKAPVGAGLRDYARITAVVPEDRRPWTSASRADDGALTVECANSSGPPDYGISEASHRACARLAAYALRAYGVPLQRATAANGWRGHMGHREVVGAFGDGYATACPLHLDIDYILELAGGDPAIGGDALGRDDMFDEQRDRSTIDLTKYQLETKVVPEMVRLPAIHAQVDLLRWQMDKLTAMVAAEDIDYDKLAAKLVPMLAAAVGDAVDEAEGAPSADEIADAVAAKFLNGLQS